MSCDGNGDFQGKMSVRYDGVSRADFIIPINGTAAGHLHTVVDKGTAFCNQQVIPAVFFVNMGRFNPTAVGFLSVPDNAAFSFKLQGDRVQFV